MSTNTKKSAAQKKTEAKVIAVRVLCIVLSVMLGLTAVLAIVNGI